MAIEQMIDQFGGLSPRGYNGMFRQYSTPGAPLYELHDAESSYAAALGSSMPSGDPGVNDPQGHVNFTYPVPDDCSGLMVTQQLLINEIYHANQMIAAGEGAKSTKPWIIAFQQRLLEVNNKISALKCVQVEEQAQAAVDQGFTLAALAQASTPAPGSQDNTNKYIIWGIGGVMILGAAVILLKKKSS